MNKRVELIEIPKHIKSGQLDQLNEWQFKKYLSNVLKTWIFRRDMSFDTRKVFVESFADYLAKRILKNDPEKY